MLKSCCIAGWIIFGLLTHAYSKAWQRIDDAEQFYDQWVLGLESRTLCRLEE